MFTTMADSTISESCEDASASYLDNAPPPATLNDNDVGALPRPSSQPTSPPPWCRGSNTSPLSLYGPRSYRVPNRPLVYVTRRIPQKGMDILLGICDVKQWDAEEPVPRGELLFSVCGADAIFCMPGDVIDADVLDAAGPNLQVIATTSSSTGSHIDVTACEERGVQVLTCPDQPSESLADLTVALVLLTIKETQTEEERLVNFDLVAPDLIPTTSDPSTTSGTQNTAMEILTNARTHSRPRLIKQMSEERLAFQWNKGKPGNANSSTWRNILKKRFGIYGLTRFGISVARLLNSLGVSDVIVADRSWETDVENRHDAQGAGSFFKMASLDELLTNSDVICVCDGSPECDNEKELEEQVGGKYPQVVFCQEAFAKMKSSSILVMPHRRQPAVDYVDLYTALRDGQIRAAGLNDCNQQPVPLKAPLLGLKNCVFLPQTQEAVYDMRHKVSVLMAQNLKEALSLTREKSQSM